MFAQLCGFVQFLSPVFIVGSSKNVLIKITSQLNCLCSEGCFHILVTWKGDESKAAQYHRETFIEAIRNFMHEYVHFGSLKKKTLFSGRPKESKVWCYVPEHSSVKSMTPNMSTSSQAHQCHLWPPNLLGSIEMTIQYFGYRCIRVVASPLGSQNSPKELYLPPVFKSSDFLQGEKVQAYGIWLIEGRYLVPSILTCFKPGKADFSPLISSSDTVLRLALFDKLLVGGDLPTENKCFESPDQWVEATFDSITVPKGIAPVARLIDEFIHPNLSGAPKLNYRILTAKDFSSAIRSDFKSCDRVTKLINIEMRIFEPITSSHAPEIILIGILGLDMATGALTIQLPPQESLVQPKYGAVPLLLPPSSGEADQGVEPLLDRLVMIKQPHIVTTDSAISEESTTVNAFGRSLSPLPRISVFATCLPVVLSPCITGIQSKHQTPNKAILLRYVSSPSFEGTFNIRYECVTKTQNNEGLQNLVLRGNCALWALARGLFTVGSRLHMNCHGKVKPTCDVDRPMTSQCRHLIGLHKWRVLCVQDVLNLMRSEGRSHEDHWVTVQGYVLHKAKSTDETRRVKIWLIDCHRNDPFAAAPLRVDLVVPSKSANANSLAFAAGVKDLMRLPVLTHVCIFKAHLWADRLVSVLSPSRFQVSPNGLPRYFDGYAPSNAPLSVCQCFTEVSTTDSQPLCSVCVQHNFSIESYASLQSSFDLLCDLKEESKTCLVQLIRCFEFKVLLHECSSDSVQVLLVVLLSDGSATGVLRFDHIHHWDDRSSETLQWLAIVLGLEESITRNVVKHLAQVGANTSKDPVWCGLDAWLQSPGFLRPLLLPLKCEPSSERTSDCWRLERVTIGREVRLTVPPVLRLRLSFS